MKFGICFFISYYISYFGMNMIFPYLKERTIWNLIYFNSYLYSCTIHLFNMMSQREGVINKYISQIKTGLTENEYIEVRQYIQKREGLYYGMMKYNIWNMMVVCFGVCHKLYYMEEKISELDGIIWGLLYLFFSYILLGKLSRINIKMRELINHKFVPIQV
jgi:hypothetical protein